MSDESPKPDWDFWAGVALSALTLGFAACLVRAALVYPGGTWCEPARPGYDLLRSFFCDLLHTQGLNGAPNPAAPPARVGLLLAGLAFFPFWLTVPRTLGFGGRPATLVRNLGALSALLSLAVALTPSDSWPTLHRVAVLSASASGIAAAVLALGAGSGSASASGRVLRGLGWAALVTAALDAGLYAKQVFFPEPCAVLLPMLQKLAAFLILAWMLGSAWVLLRPRSSRRE